jgi:hypothetical protein
MGNECLNTNCVWLNICFWVGMLIGMSLSMLFVKHMLNKELLYTVSCFEMFFFLNMDCNLYIVHKQIFNCCIYSMIIYHFRYSHIILQIWKSLFWKGLLKARPKLTCITFCFIMWNRVSVQSVSIRTLAFLCSYITLTKVLVVSTLRCLQFIHRQYALEIKQHIWHIGMFLVSFCLDRNKM